MFEHGDSLVVEDAFSIVSGKLLRLIDIKQDTDFRVFALDQNVLTACMGNLVHATK